MVPPEITSGTRARRATFRRALPMVLLVMAHCAALALLVVFRHYCDRRWAFAEAVYAFASGQVTLLLVWLVIGRSGVGLRLAGCASAAFVMIAALSFSYVEANQRVLRSLSGRETWDVFVWLLYFANSNGGKLATSLPFQAGGVMFILTLGRVYGLLGARPNRFQLTLVDLFAVSFGLAFVLGVALSLQPYDGWYREFVWNYWRVVVSEPTFPLYWHAWEGIISATAAAMGYWAFLCAHANWRRAVGFSAALATLCFFKQTVLLWLIVRDLVEGPYLAELLLSGIASSVSSILCVGGTLLLVGWWRRRGSGVPEDPDGGAETPLAGVP